MDDQIPFEEITAQLLSESNEIDRGFTSYDLISRTLHQLARDGSHELLSLALERLGDQSARRINQLDDQKLAPLHYAARYSHPFTVLTLLQRKAQVNIRGQYGLTPLHCAARYRKSLVASRKQRKSRSRGSVNSMNFQNEESASDNLNVEFLDDAKRNLDNKQFLTASTESLSIGEGYGSVVKILIENGADIDARDVYGSSPLHYAAMRGHDVAAQELLSFENVNIESRDKQLMTPLIVAATFGYVDICELLVDKGADIYATDESAQTPLHKAAAEGHLEIVEMLLKKAFEMSSDEGVKNYFSIQDWERLTPLHLSVINWNNKVTDILLSNGANVNTVSDTLSTPLHAAAANGDTEMLTLLIKFGASIEATDIDQQTALHKAAANNQVESISLLLDHNANIEKKDKDSFTPFLVSASSGHSDSLTVLLSFGARSDVIDRDDKTAIMWCAQEGHYDCMKVLLNDTSAQELIDFSDSFDNSPLHEASRNGHFEVVQLLLDKGSKIDNKNEDEEAALHMASEMGHTEVVKLLLRKAKYIVNDENEDGDTALHLAATRGREEAVEVLLKHNASVEARNTRLWTPLDCASANGHVGVCRLLIDHDSPIDPLDKTKTTPLQLASEGGHVEVIDLLLSKGASVSVLDSSKRNALEIAIVAGQHDAALSIVKSGVWMDAMKNARTNPFNENRTTPFRLLIQKFPDIAKVALDRCITTNGMETDHPTHGIKFDFELIDDSFIIRDPLENLLDVSSAKASFTDYEYPFNEKGELLSQAEPYTESTRALRNNHPLMLMVKYNRSELLGHPVCLSLLKHKWRSYTRYFYYFNLVFYVVFLSFLTGYICSSTDWKHAAMFMLQKNVTLSSDQSCAFVQDVLDIKATTFMVVAKWVIIAMTAFNIILELIQICQARMNYIGLENLMEWFCYVGALLFVINWRSDNIDCVIREEWQWQLGALVIFAAWMNLVLFLRKISFFGIYVVMFTDIFATFCKFFVVFFLFVVAFALSFYMVFRSKMPFAYVGSSLLKTSVMMIGEMEFDAIFHNDQHSEGLQYPVVSHLLFIGFLVLMSILIMNLLIGLAVDDIKLVQEEAALKRRVMQTQLIMDVEMLIPESLLRYFSRSYIKYFPNQKRSWMQKVFGDFSALQYLNSKENEFEVLDKEDLLQSIKKVRSEIQEIKTQNQKMYSLFVASLAFHKRMKRIESIILSKDN